MKSRCSNTQCMLCLNSPWHEIGLSLQRDRIIRLAHCKCKSLKKWSLCLSVPHQISKTKQDKHEILSPL